MAAKQFSWPSLRQQPATGASRPAAAAGQAPLSGQPDDRLRSARRQALFRETLVGLFINAALFPLLIWLVNIAPPATVGGANGVVSTFAKATLFPVFLMTICLTPVLRMRVRKGLVPALDGSLPWLKYLPKSIVLRAVVLCMVSIVLLAPIGLAVVLGFGLYPLSKPWFTVMNVCYGVLTGSAVTPVVAAAAMADRSGKQLSSGDLVNPDDAT